ncbi:PAS domain-containing protein [Methylobacterium sp. NEAU 140]|uniref:PAS domain-containing protein n=1 Tax=Methylobacterium sp. NEAU 140 TaxID=3064945 RepID=UPI002737035F|nr:PAS domain-containing protein [Methylobacterium sp. NEAU 140]MDP4024954.1 PAS domain-containing protein [Methylobacterium sp. NEAU 140]
MSSTAEVSAARTHPVPPMAGGGAMGRRVRETDWSATPLGAYATWPQSLRFALSLVLNAKGIAALYWGERQWLLYNDAYAAALGDRHPWAFGRPMPEALADIAPVLGPQVAEVLRTGEGFAIENLPLTMRRHGRDEETVWTYGFSPVQGETGDFAGVLLLATEMTRQKASERSEERIKTRLETALRVARLGSYDWHTATGVVELNARAREIFALPPDGPVRDAEVFARMAPDELERVRAEAMAAVGLGVPFDESNLKRVIDIDYDIVHPDGSRRSIASSGAVVQDPDGARRMVGTFSDVTDLKRAETRLREQNATLEQRVEERTAERNQIWRVSQDMLMVSDLAGVFLSVNPAWTRVLGWTEAELVGRTSEWLEHPDDRERTRAEIARLAGHGTPTLSFENRFRTRGGDYRTLAWTAVPEGDRFYCVARDITGEQARAVAQADAERVRLALSAGAIIGTWVWDLRADRFTVDEAFATAFGLDPALGREGIPLARIVATVHPADQAGLAAAITEAVERGGRYAHQYRVRRHDGRYHWLEANGHVERGPDGTPLRFPGVLLDAASRRLDAVLSELSERLRGLDTPEEMALAAAETVGLALDLSRVAYGDMDVTGQRIVVRPDWLAPGQPSIAGVHDFKDYGSYIEELRRGEDAVIADVATDPRTSGQVESFRAMDVRALVNLPLMERGRLKVVFCLNYSVPHAWTADELTFARRVMDRTEVEIARRVAEGELRALNASLERQVAERTQERDRVWRNAQDLQVVIDADGVLRAVSPSATRLLGWTPEEMVGRSLFAFTHPDGHPASRDALRQATREPLPSHRNQYRHKDGTYRTISWITTPENGLIYCYGRDVTVETEQAHDLLQAEEALRQSQKMEAIGQLTGGVAHDFNNLLTVIKSSTDLLKRPNLAEERRARYVGAISDTVDRAARLTGQLLAFARRQALKPEVFDAADGVRGLADMMRTLTGSRVHIATDLPAVPCYVDADASQFDTALVNLAVNARDAMNGEGRINIRVGVVEAVPATRSHPRVAGAYVAVSLGDTGSGIPAGMVERIFEPFFTTKEVGKGTGLGLSQVIGFAKQSGGDVTVESTVGTGTTFTLFLPRVSAPARVEAEEETEALIDGQGTRVLVVEDNVEVGTFAVQTLSDLGYVPTLAADGTAALAALAEGADRFDVVFSDVMMPGMSGVELGQEVRRRYHDVPMVLTSGYSHVLAKDGTHGFELLHKPYSVEQLSQILRKAAGKRRRKQVTRQPFTRDT